MDLLQTISSLCSIGSFLVAIFVAQKVISIQAMVHSNNTNVTGDKNAVAGNDVNIKQ